jgi:hypothetical protein
LRVTFVIGENVASGFVFGSARVSRAGERVPALAKFSFDSRRKFIELLTGKVRFSEPPKPVCESRALSKSVRKKFFATSDFPSIFASSASDV